MAKSTINECATDDITAGIVGTCSTHEALGLSTVAITLIIAAPLLVLCCAYYIFSRTKPRILNAHPKIIFLSVKSGAESAVHFFTSNQFLRKMKRKSEKEAIACYHLYYYYYFGQIQMPAACKRIIYL